MSRTDQTQREQQVRATLRDQLECKFDLKKI